jgi:hypothetical protein
LILPSNHLGIIKKTIFSLPLSSISFLKFPLILIKAKMKKYNPIPSLGPKPFLLPFFPLAQHHPSSFLS